MPGFLYYTPDPSRTALAAIVADGLGYAFERQPDVAPLFGDGPDGGRGAVVADGQRVHPSQLGYYRDRQTWRQIPGSAWWIGHYTGADAPGPEILERPRMLEGHTVELADGRGWTIPVARQWREVDEWAGYVNVLPRRSHLNAAGEWEVGDVLPRFKRFWDVARKYFRNVAGPGVSETAGVWSEADGSADFLFGEIHQAAVTALSINYYLGPCECDLLGLLTRHHCDQILEAAIDFPTIERWSKKKRAVT
jgi:hypothetical protein